MRIDDCYNVQIDKRTGRLCQWFRFPISTGPCMDGVELTAYLVCDDVLSWTDDSNPNNLFFARLNFFCCSFIKQCLLVVGRWSIGVKRKTNSHSFAGAHEELLSSPYMVICDWYNLHFGTDFLLPLEYLRFQQTIESRLITRVRFRESLAVPVHSELSE